MKKLLVECLDCGRHEVVDSFYCDGLRCKCGGGYKAIRETTLPLTINSRSKRNPLLTIELENDTSVPKVFYKGEEITNKINVQFDWETDTDIPGGVSYAIEHVEDKGVNRIERKVRGHIFDQEDDQPVIVTVNKKRGPLSCNHCGGNDYEIMEGKNLEGVILFERIQCKDCGCVR